MTPHQAIAEYAFARARDAWAKATGARGSRRNLFTIAVWRLGDAP